MLRPEEVQNCKKFLIKGDLKSCLKILFDLSDKLHVIERDIYLLSGRYEQLERDYLEGIIDFDMYERKRTGIQRGLLDLLEKVPVDSPVTLKEYPQDTPSAIHIWPLITGILFLISAGISSYMYVMPPEGSIVTTGYSWKDDSIAGLPFGRLDINFIKADFSTERVKFFYNLSDIIPGEYCLAQRIDPIQLFSNYTKKEECETDNQFDGDCQEFQLIAPLRSKERFKLSVYFEKHPDNILNQDIRLLYNGLNAKIIHSSEEILDPNISKSQISLIQELNIFIGLKFFLIISSILFLLFVINFLYWKKQ